MKHIVVATVFAMVLGVSAFAQSTPSDRQSMPQGTNPSTQPSTQTPQTPDMSSSTDQGQSHSKGETKLKGCIQSASGGYTLEDKHGKTVPLTGAQDLASHVGHTVTVHGSFGGSSSGASATAASGASTGDQFTVSKIDMVSDTCKEKADKGKDKDSKPTPYHN